MSTASCLSSLCRNHRAFFLNSCIIIFLILYVLTGGAVLLHFELKYAQHLRLLDRHLKRECVERLFIRHGSLLRSQSDSRAASSIISHCLSEKEESFRHEWSYKSAALYAFGILTTLGYGKIEPRTRNGRVFVVVYGFFGIPITVILLTNLGRYLESITLRLKRFVLREKMEVDGSSMKGWSLFCLVVFYLVVGALLIPLLDGQIDFFNGIYFAFICLTAIEYGDLVPHNNLFVPIVILYVCIGLAISTIALDLGSVYVRKLHYLGRKIRNIANVKIWFGSKDLRVHELVNAVGQNIGLEDSLMRDIDLEYLVQVAIQVKEGRLIRVPQTHIIEGIWPPELVPLFMKDGNFPEYVDSTEKPLEVPDELPPPLPKKNSVRFSDDYVPRRTSSIRRSILRRSNASSHRLFPPHSPLSHSSPLISLPSPTKVQVNEVDAPFADE